MRRLKVETKECFFFWVFWVGFGFGGGGCLGKGKKEKEEEGGSSALQ
jgi:uncharacterized spore protein YtfJ